MNLKKLPILLVTVAMLTACGGRRASEQDGPESPDSTDSSSADIEAETLDEVIALIKENAKAHRGKHIVEEYVQEEYLGNDLVYEHYSGEYAPQDVEYIIQKTDAGIFVYEREEGATEFTLTDGELDPTKDIYADEIYSIYDLLGLDFLNKLTLKEKTDDGFKTDLDLTGEDETTYYLKAYLATFLGYLTSDGDYVTGAEITLGKTGRDLEFAVSFGEYGTEVTTLTEFGNHKNVEIEEIAANFPAYEPPVVPDGFNTAVAKLMNDAESGVALVTASTGVRREYLSEDVYYSLYPDGSKALIFNYEDNGYYFIDEGEGYKQDASKAGGYDIYESYYTFLDVIDDSFADAMIFQEEKDDTYEGEFKLSKAGNYADSGLMSLAGYSTIYCSYIDEVTFSMPKDGTAVTFTVSLPEADVEFTVTISEIGTLTDAAVFADIETLKDSLVPPEPEAFPSEYAAAVVQILAPGSTTVIPGLEGGEYYDEYIDLDDVTDYGYGEIDVYGDSDLEDAYIDILLDNGWTATEGGYLSPNGDIFIEIEYDDFFEGLWIYISLYTPASTEWPASDIAEILGDDVTDVLPAFTGENDGFLILDDMYGTAVQVFLEEGSEADAINAYIAILSEKGYKLVGTSYVSANEQIMVSVEVGTGNSIVISFMRYPFMDAVENLPVGDLNTFLETYDLGFSIKASDIVDPSGNGFIIDEGLSYIYHYFEITVSGNAFDTYVTSISGIVTENGYEFDGDFSTSTHYVYVNGDYHEIDISYDSATNTTTITFWE